MLEALLPEWINRDFIQLTKDKDYYYKRAHKTNDPDDWKTAKSLRNKVNNMNKYLKETYCSKAINENLNDSKKLWSTIKKLIPDNKSSVHAVKTYKGFTVNDKETAVTNSMTSLHQLEVTLLKKLVLLIVMKVLKVNYVNDQFCFDFISPEFVFDEIC